MYNLEFLVLWQMIDIFAFWFRVHELEFSCLGAQLI